MRSAASPDRLAGTPSRMAENSRKSVPAGWQDNLRSNNGSISVGKSNTAAMASKTGRNVHATVGSAAHCQATVLMARTCPQASTDAGTAEAWRSPDLKTSVPCGLERVIS